MNRPSAIEFRRTLLTLVASMIGGALAGAIAGWTVAPSVPADVRSPASSTPSTGGTTSTPSTPNPNTDVTVIPVDRRPQPSLIPAPFLNRQSSSVASVFRRPRAGESGLLTDERVLGQAVAVTSDGWFVVPASVMDGVRMADALLWNDGRAATATRAVLDRSGNVIFLKTPFTDVSAPAFARAADVTPGLAAWLERRTRRFEPAGITALFEPAQSLDGVASEASVRRGVASGIAAEGDLGAPIWSSNGALIGIVASVAGEPLQYIPSSVWTASLSSLLSSNEIRHAFLGVNAVDVATIQSDRSLRLPAERGAWLRDNTSARKPAVEKGSPAATAGLRTGDVIQRVDRDILDGSADLGELLASYRAGSRVTLTVLRGVQTFEVPVDLGSVVTGEELK